MINRLLAGVNFLVIGEVSKTYTFAAFQGVKLPEDVKDIVIGCYEDINYSVFIVFCIRNHMEAGYFCGNSLRVAEKKYS